ncbi:MAG: hypothetical protein IZT59_06950 [Verrucomicrobia bacterium]|jgi:hypothetical protein|nr:hypothetical protein [Verrucomicrobiota bacterium]|tara:strand:+ start:8365 stop:9201 length:837 start_codon:yes stop_codon:yes gene_type:complete
MNAPEQIVCKPTPWFTLRAGAMLAMFGVFSVLFYIDGTTGYRKKNLTYYTHASFQQASDTFAKMNSEGKLTPGEWKEFSEEQTVSLPKDKSVMPVDTEIPLPWPAILSDFEKMKPLQPHLLWQEYSAEKELNNDPPEHPFDAGKIGEQIIVFYICLGLTIIALFFLIRTMLRSIRADSEALTTVKEQRIPYTDMKTLDLRKWDTKGLALVEYDGASGSGKTRIDGLTYGGFKKENDEPAEQLMQKIRANFSGEIIEYTTLEEKVESDTTEETPAKPKN